MTTISNYRIPIVGPEAPATAWQEASRNQVWSARSAAGEPPMEIFEAVEDAFVKLPQRERLFHVIPAGRMHRISHAFGFWRTCGADGTYVGSEYEGGFAHLLIVGLHYATYTSDTLTWLCQSCGTPLRTAEVPTRRIHLAGLIKRALEEVRAFNADEKQRTCSSCGTVHPLSYGFEPSDDNDAERAARTSW
jgi:hypothetical protein